MQYALKNEVNVGKIKGLNKKYGNTFFLTKQEREQYKELLSFEIAELTNQTVNGTA